MQVMSRSDVRKIRGNLLIKGLTVRNVAEKFKVSDSAVNQAITGDSTSARLQKFISEQIGYWPWPHKLGERRERPE